MPATLQRRIPSFIAVALVFALIAFFPALVTQAQTTALPTPNTVWGWGGRGYEVSRTPTRIPDELGHGFLADVAQVSGGGSAVLLKNDGTILLWDCVGIWDGWGWPWPWPVRVDGFGTPANPVVAVATNGLVAALLRDGTVQAWTPWDMDHRPAQIRTAEGYLVGNVKQVATNGAYVLMLRTDGTVCRWKQETDVLSQIPGPGGLGLLRDVTKLAAESLSYVALRSDGTVWTWGDNYVGQLGDGTRTNRPYPVQVKGPGGVGQLTDIVDIRTQEAFVLALRSDGTVWGWGYNVNGTLGDGTNTQRLVPTQTQKWVNETLSPLTDVVAISAGDSFALAQRSDGSLWGWGANRNGELGTVEYEQIPAAVPLALPGDGELKLVAFSAVSHYAIAVMAPKEPPSGAAWGWGSRYGNVNRTPTPVPGELGTGLTAGVTQVSGGGLQALLLRKDGSVLRWECGATAPPGGAAPQPWPARIEGLGAPGNPVVSIAAGGDYSAAVLDDGTAWIWPAAKATPTMLTMSDGTALMGVTQVSSGNPDVLLVLSDGTVRRWRYGLSEPVAVAGPGGTGLLSNVKKAVAGGYYNYVALLSDGTVWAWGDNTFAVVGDGTTTNRPNPVQVKGPGGVGFLTGITDVSTTGGHVLALRSDGTVWGWGTSPQGAIGNGTNLQSRVPSQVLKWVDEELTPLTDVVAVATGDFFSLAQRSDGSLWGWGDNRGGQLGSVEYEEMPAAVRLALPGSGNLKLVTFAAVNRYALVVMANPHPLGVTATVDPPWIYTSTPSLARRHQTATLRLSVDDPAGPQGYAVSVTPASPGAGVQIEPTADPLVWKLTGGWLAGAPGATIALNVAVTGQDDNNYGSTRAGVGLRQPGDLDGNGVFDSADVALLADRLNGWDIGIPASAFDFDSDGHVTIADTIRPNKLIRARYQQRDADFSGRVLGWGSDANGEIATGGTGFERYPRLVRGPGGLPVMQNVVAADGGDYHSLLLTGDGQVWAMGSNEDGQLGIGEVGGMRSRPTHVRGPDGEPTLTGIRAISTGPNHSLALTTDGRVLAWGRQERAIEDEPFDLALPTWIPGPDGTGQLQGIVSIAAGVSQSLAVASDGRVWEWGEWVLPEEFHTSLTPSLVKGHGGEGYLENVVTAAVSEDYHAFAVLSDGTLWHWGYVPWVPGSLTHPTTVYRRTEDSVIVPVSDVVAMRAYPRFVVYLTSDTTVWTYYHGSITHVQTAPFELLSGIVAVDGNNSHKLALSSDGSVYSWGGMDFVGRPAANVDEARYPAPVSGIGGQGTLGGAVAVACGSSHSLIVLSDGTVVAWGNNRYGELGQESSTIVPLPTAILGFDGSPPFEDAVAVSAAGYSLAGRLDGTVWGWGRNSHGQLGDGTLEERHAAVRTLSLDGTGPLTDVLRTATGAYRALAIRSDGTVWTWGGDTSVFVPPAQVIDSAGNEPLQGIVDIATAQYHFLALDAVGAVRAWGASYYGEAGYLDGKYIYHDKAAAISDANGPLIGASAIAAGRYASLAVCGGHVWGWGHVPQGDADWVDTATAVLLPGPDGAATLDHVQAVAGSPTHFLALRSDGTVVAWGKNDWGQLGIETDNSTEVHPVVVCGPDGTGRLDRVVAVAAGYYYSLALRDDGTLWSWGRNDGCCLGDGTTVSRHIPAPVLTPDGSRPLENVFAIAAGYYHALAIVARAVPMNVTASIDRDWIYQNGPQTTKNRHFATLTLDVDDPNGNATCTVAVTPNVASENRITVEATDNPLVWRIMGGPVAQMYSGEIGVNVDVLGNERGGAGLASATLTLRRLGDITGEGEMTQEDVIELRKRLNGLPTPGVEGRAFDLDGDGNVTTADSVILNAILNGLTIP